MIIKDVTGKKQIHIAKFLGYYDQMQNALRGKCTSSRDQILASPLPIFVILGKFPLCASNYTSAKQRQW